MNIRDRCRELGITFPEPNLPAGLYAPLVRDGDIVYTSGQTPKRAGELVFKGKVGNGASLEQGYEAARLCALNCIAQIEAVYGADNIERILKVTGFVASAPDFFGQPKVMDGASSLLQDIFGENGVAARSAIGVAVLPGDSTCEVEMVVKMKR